MLARDVMTGPVITLRPAHTVRWAVRVLLANAVTAAPVLDDDGTLVGIVSEMDLLRGEFQPDPRTAMRPILGHAAPPPLRVEEVMTRQVVTVTPTTDVARLVELLIAERVKSLPVLEGERVVGMVSRRDLIRMLARSDEELRADVIAALTEQYPLGPSWDVTVEDGVATLSGHADDRHDRIADLLTRTVPGVTRVRHLP
ncbi:CBS domain-containing protein [Streptosporangium longisporum]|uniref:CBS domain-containing protein n=1 Tax=Streptosporangium longisporum TaxID=46187 RepID=A0ABN3XS74_9ACTN